MKIFIIALFIIHCSLFMSCREETPIFTPETEKVCEPEMTSVSGFYLLNEGNMGTNKATLDFLNYRTGIYTRNIYEAANPNVAMALGDVGNDLKIYGSRLYAVINCSNKIEIMDAKTAQRIGQVEIPNCRNICFAEGYAYVTSFAGKVIIDPDYRQIGYVAKIDTATLQVVEKCSVGFQPEGIAVANGKIYVANSGGYMSPNYENTVSVIDLQHFTETKRIMVARNLHQLLLDNYENLWVSTHSETASQLYNIDTQTDKVTDSLNLTVSNFALVGDSLYIIGYKNGAASYAIVNVADKQLVANKIIADGTEKSIKIPYTIAINPATRDIFISDAKDYVTPGILYCFDKNGRKKWSVRTGDIPASIVFLQE